MNNNQRSHSQPALRRLVIVVAVVIGFILYAYGFTVTDISLEETQDEVRQSSVQRALRELLSPDIFDQDTTNVSATASFEKECSGQTVEQPAHEGSQQYIVLTPACGVRNEVVTVEGFNFPINSTGRIYLVRPSGERQPFQLVNDAGNTAFTIDGRGHFAAQITIPNLRGDAGSLHQIDVEAEVPVGAPYLSGTSRIVIEKMIETIFLALMATTLALPISVFLSFLGAHNLMREVRIPLGNALVTFALLPVGWLVGTAVLGAVGTYGVDLGKGLLGAALPAVVIFAFAFASQSMGKIKGKPDSLEERLREQLMGVLLLVVVIFVLGLLGGLGIWLGEVLTEGLAGYIGYLLGTLGQLIELSMGLIAGVAGAFYVSSLGTRVTTNLLKGIRGLQSHIAAGVLGAISGGLLMAGVSLIGSTAALFTVIPPLVAAIMGGAVVARLYARYFGAEQRVRNGSSQLVMLVGAAVTFVVTAVLLDVLHFVVIGRLPSQDFVTLSALIGAVLGAAGGLVAGLHASFPMGDVIYNVTRTILNALRSIEPLIMGIIFVIWVSIGPFAGVLALTLHSIASLGKLYSEQIESIDLGPIEAIQSTGATRLQTIIYAVVPQVIPPYIAFTMYRWDINVRMSTIIGFVGGGGIGFLLQQQINLLRYDQAGVAVLAIAIVVSVLDYASAAIRERYT